MVNLDNGYGESGEPVVVRAGLWQLCTGDSTMAPECDTFSRDVTSEVNVLRILMVISLVGLA